MGYKEAKTELKIKLLQKIWVTEIIFWMPPLILCHFFVNTLSWMMYFVIEPFMKVVNTVNFLY